MKSSSYLAITALLSAGKREEALAQLQADAASLSLGEREECLGNALFYEKEYQQAVAYYEAAMESSPEYDCARYHYLIGVQKERAGALTEAFKRYQAAIEIEPSFADAYFEMGGLLFRVGDYTGALQCFTDALPLAPNDLALHQNLVTTLGRLAQDDPATYAQGLEKARSDLEQAKTRLSAPDESRRW